MKNKTCLITGGNAGIGKAAAIQLAKEGVEVIIACRNKERAELALENIKSESGNNTVNFVVMCDLSHPLYRQRFPSHAPAQLL